MIRKDSHFSIASHTHIHKTRPEAAFISQKALDSNNKTYTGIVHCTMDKVNFFKVFWSSNIVRLKVLVDIYFFFHKDSRQYHFILSRYWQTGFVFEFSIFSVRLYFLLKLTLYIYILCCLFSFIRVRPLKEEFLFRAMVCVCVYHFNRFGLTLKKKRINKKKKRNTFADKMCNSFLSVLILINNNY